MDFNKNQFQNSIDIINGVGSNPSEYARHYSDFLCSTVGFQVFLNGVANTTLGGGTDLGGRPGQVILTTGTSSGGEGRIGSTITTPVLLTSGFAKFETSVFLPVLSVAAQEFEVNSGFTVGNRDVAAGVFFYYNAVFRGLNWHCSIRNFGVDNIIDSGVVVNINTWYKLTVIASSSSARFFINGNLISTVNTGIPTAALSPIVNIAKWAGTTARTMQVDYVDLGYKFSTKR
jgi:hypothetical protein